MHSPVRSYAKAHLVVTILAALDAVACFAVTAWLWAVISSRQPMWPLPAAYLIEVVVLSILAATATVRRYAIDWALTLMAAGAILAFAMLAILSIGIYYVPIAGLFLVTGMLMTWAAGRSALAAAAWFVVSAMVQVTVILVLSSVL